MCKVPARNKIGLGLRSDFARKSSEVLDVLRRCLDKKCFLHKIVLLITLVLWGILTSGLLCWTSMSEICLRFEFQPLTLTRKWYSTVAEILNPNPAEQPYRGRGFFNGHISLSLNLIFKNFAPFWSEKQDLLIAHFSFLISYVMHFDQTIIIKPKFC